MFLREVTRKETWLATGRAALPSLAALVIGCFLSQCACCRLTSNQALPVDRLQQRFCFLLSFIPSMLNRSDCTAKTVVNSPLSSCSHSNQMRKKEGKKKSNCFLDIFYTRALCIRTTAVPINYKLLDQITFLIRGNTVLFQTFFRLCSSCSSMPSIILRSRVQAFPKYVS